MDRKEIVPPTEKILEKMASKYISDDGDKVVKRQNLITKREQRSKGIRKKKKWLKKARLEKQKWKE